MKLRHPNPGDMGQLVTLAGLMHRESWFRDFDFDPAAVEAFITRAMEADFMLALVLEAAGGGIAGFFCAAEATHFFGRDRYACDVAVYVHPDHRGGPGFVRMMKAYEAWCRIRGVREIHIGLSTGIELEKTARLYEKLGYADPVTGYRKKCVWPGEGRP